MSIRNICIIVFLVIFDSSVSNAQHFIGFTGGYCVGTFFNYTKEQDYNAIYHFKNGIAFSSFYETKMDSVCYVRVELQYKWQLANMKIDYKIGHSAFHDNMEYSLHLLSLNLTIPFRLVEKNKFKFNFLFGFNSSYNINTIAKDLTSLQIIHNSKDLSKFNFGMEIGSDFIIPINNKIDFLLQNRYNIFFTNIITQKNLKYTSLFTGYLNIGFRYKLKQRQT